jgi:tRNA(Ser,Leu) C12 N-acetylase TAN1
MKDWNVVVSVFQDGFGRALRALQKLGVVERSPYHNVLVMQVEDPVVLLEAIEKRTEENPALYDAISRVAPAIRDFDFVSEEEFVERAKSIMHEWSPNLAGCSFHVRLRRRGTKHDLRTHETERLFNDAIVDVTTRAGTPSTISFTDPDVVIAIDTIDNRAGLAMWTREELARFHLLRPD